MPAHGRAHRSTHAVSHSGYDGGMDQNTSQKSASSGPSIAADAYAQRRRALLESLDGALGVLFAGDAPADDLSAWRPHPHFEYLTGVTDEPGAILLLDPSHPIESRRAALFLRPLDPEKEKWDGYRAEIGQVLRDRTGFAALFRHGHFPRFLSEAARRCRTLACLHPLAWHTQPVSPDLALFQKVCERVPDARIIDRTHLIVTMRSIKSDDEVAMIRHAVKITAESFREVRQMIEPGKSEFDVQIALEHGYKVRGSSGAAYGSIVGSGLQSTVLHYHANNGPLHDGDLVCIDSGARWGGYGADITRTYPIGGRFTDRQREIYDVVLAALEAATNAVRPGVTIAALDAAARKIIQDAGFGDFFIHGIGHHLGLETHDANPDLPLANGNVITIEPGIYLPAEGIGIRLEDDVLVTPTGFDNLSEAIPRRAQEVERQ